MSSLFIVAFLWLSKSNFCLLSDCQAVGMHGYDLFMIKILNLAHWWIAVYQIWQFCQGCLHYYLSPLRICLLCIYEKFSLLSPKQDLHRLSMDKDFSMIIMVTMLSYLNTFGPLFSGLHHWKCTETLQRRLFKLKFRICLILLLNDIWICAKSTIHASLMSCLCVSFFYIDILVAYPSHSDPFFDLCSSAYVIISFSIFNWSYLKLSRIHLG